MSMLKDLLINTLIIRGFSDPEICNIILGGENIIKEIKNMLIKENGYDTWKEFVDMQQMGDCQDIVGDIERHFPEVQIFLGEIEVENEYKRQYMTHHWVKIDGTIYDFSKGTLKDYIDWDIYDVDSSMDENRYKSKGKFKASENNITIEQFLIGNNIVQLYNDHEGIKTVIFNPSANFWAMMLNILGKILFFTRKVIDEINFDIINKIIIEFDIKNTKNIKTIYCNVRTNQVILELKDNSIKISKLYGCLGYGGKTYCYEIEHCFVGFTQSVQGQKYILINGTKYIVV